MEFDWSIRETQFIGIPGGNVECRTWGPDPAKAPTLLLLHEGLGCVELWRDFPQALCDRFDMGVFAYSRHGYGRSADASLPKPFDYHFREALEVLPAVLKVIAPKKLVLFGHSDGATIATLYASRHCEDASLAGIVTVAPHYFVEEIAATGIRAARLAYHHDHLRARLSRYHDHPDTAFYGWADTWLNPAMANWDIRDELIKLRHLVLAIQGELDEYGTGEQIDVIGRLSPAPVTQVLLPDCGHAPHAEARDAVMDALCAFLKSLPADEN